MDAAVEIALLRKLVREQHLNVPERRLLPHGGARASLLIAAAEEAVLAHGWLPIDWRPAHDYAGGLVELLPDSSCRIHWKDEVSYQRYELMEVQQLATPREAAAAWLRRMFGEAIDGIPIDWTG